MPPSPPIAPAPPTRRCGDRSMVHPTKQVAAETRRLILMMQAGWVAVGLIAVASFGDRAPVAPSAPQRSETPLQPVVATPSQPLRASSIIPDPAVLFASGSESLVARTVGHAEGTRAPDGSRTPAFFGHTDPGNGVWNLGSFSFQHCREPRYQCTTPEQADVFQLQRLQNQSQQIRQRSRQLGLQVTVEEELNAIDLANQAPLAALSQPGYPDYLAQAKSRGLKGQAAILDARLWSFWNPQAKRWDAPGLGNTEDRIRHDQQRRLLAIARVLMVYPESVVAQATPEQYRRWLNLKLVTENPYRYETQRSQYLWWDAGYWDARLKRERQVKAGFEPTYDEGFQHGSGEAGR